MVSCHGQSDGGIHLIGYTYIFIETFSGKTTTKNKKTTQFIENKTAILRFLLLKCLLTLTMFPYKLVILSHNNHTNYFIYNIVDRFFSKSRVFDWLHHDMNISIFICFTK